MRSRLRIRIEEEYMNNKGLGVVEILLIGVVVFFLIRWVIGA